MFVISQARCQPRGCVKSEHVDLKCIRVQSSIHLVKGVRRLDALYHASE